MTCVWDSLLHGIPAEKFLQKNMQNKPNQKDFVALLKNNNKKINNITVNAINLTKKEIEENYDAITNFNINSIYDGYLCSSSDPFFILICDFFQCSIHHTCVNNIIKYEINNPQFRLHIASSHSHMMFKKIDNLI